MNAMVDRRAVFCLLAAAACLLMVPLTPEAYRWVGLTLGAVYLLLAAGSYFDLRSRTRRRAGGGPPDGGAG